MEIYRSFTFDAAHKLTKVPEGHPCGNLHGHTFQVVIYVDGPTPDSTDWVIDFGDMKKVFAPTLQKLDHRYLNEIEGLENPTSENIARWIWQRLKPELSILTAVEVKESPHSGVVCRGDGD